MRAIELDEDGYAFLLANTKEIGESASSILRRLLRIDGNPSPLEEAAVDTGSELSVFLASTPFRQCRNVTDRFLAVLGELHRRDAVGFGAVLDITGRRRMYFARSEAALESSGKSVEPRRIPDSPFYAMTNASTSYKKDILRQVLTVLGFSTRAQLEAERALGG